MISVPQARLALLDKSASIILRSLDTSFFRALTPEGDLIAISRSKENRHFHVNGDLMVTTISMLYPICRILTGSLPHVARTQFYHGGRPAIPSSGPHQHHRPLRECPRGKNLAAIDATRKVLEDLASP
jgi:hypothetical protein